MKKIIVASTLIASILLGENLGLDKPNVLEYEKILKEMKSVKEEKVPMLAEPTESSYKPNVFTPIGVMKIENKKIAYVILPNSKVIKVVEGMNLMGKKITEINDYGIGIADINNSKTVDYLAIETKQLTEKDVVFQNRDKNNQNNSSGNQ